MMSCCSKSGFRKTKKAPQERKKKGKRKEKRKEKERKNRKEKKEKERKEKKDFHSHFLKNLVFSLKVLRLFLELGRSFLKV